MFWIMCMGAATVGVLSNWLASSGVLSDSDTFLSDDSSALRDDSDTDHSSVIDSYANSINPANGLPMVGCVDIEGNAYGTDSSHWDDHSSFSSSISEDSFFSSSSFDDSFSSSSMFDD